MTIYLPEDQRYSWVQGFADKLAQGITANKQRKMEQEGYKALQGLGPDADIYQQMAVASKYRISPQQVGALRQDTRATQELGMKKDEHGVRMKQYAREEAEAEIKKLTREQLTEFVKNASHLSEAQKKNIIYRISMGQDVPMDDITGMRGAVHFVQKDYHTPDGRAMSTVIGIDKYGKEIGTINKDFGVDKEWLADIDYKKASTNAVNRRDVPGGGGGKDYLWTANDQKVIDGYLGGMDALGQPLSDDQIRDGLGVALAYAQARNAPPAIIQMIQTRLKGKQMAAKVPGAEPLKGYKPMAKMTGYDPKNKTLFVDNPVLWKFDMYARDKGEQSLDSTGRPKDKAAYQHWLNTVFARYLKENRIDAIQSRGSYGALGSGKPGGVR